MVRKEAVTARCTKNQPKNKKIEINSIHITCDEISSERIVQKVHDTSENAQVKVQNW